MVTFSGVVRLQGKQRYNIHQTSNEIERTKAMKTDFVANAMREAFNLAAPPMPIFAEFTPHIQYMEDAEMDCLQAAGEIQPETTFPRL